MNAESTGAVGAIRAPVPQAPNRRPLSIADGSVEALKWLGLVLMTLDHVNKYLLNGEVVWVFDGGRVVMPLFSFVLAFNLARDFAGTSGAAMRTARRLVVFGLIATPASWLLAGPWPLNILFMLAGAAAVIALLQHGRPLGALSLGLASGFVVEFWWPAIGTTVAAWYFCRSPSWRSALAWACWISSLTLINGNTWAFACVPLIALAAHTNVAVPRMKWAFYAYYPAHLSVIWCAHRVLP